MWVHLCFSPVKTTGRLREISDHLGLGALMTGANLAPLVVSIGPLGILGNGFGSYWSSKFFSCDPKMVLRINIRN